MAASCRRMAAICWLRISTCASACEEIFFSLSSWPVSSPTLALRSGCSRAGAGGEPFVLVAIALGVGERSAQLRELVLEIGLAGFLHRQEFGELGDLRVEAGQRGVLAGDFLLQVELHHHEHGQDEDDAQDQRRQRVDEAGPVVHAAVAAAGAG